MRAFPNNPFLKNIFLPFLVLALAIVLFFISYQYLPKIDLPYSLDKIGILLAIFIVLLVLSRVFWPTLVLCTVFISLWFGNNWYNTDYNFESFYKDGEYIFRDITGVNKNNNFVYTGYGTMYNDRAILKAIDYKSSIVRSFAVDAANTNFRKEQQEVRSNETRVLIQAFAVFKKINSNWNYVSDPVKEEYFAKASESVQLLAGDCDDYSILMAGAIKSIGGRMRLLSVKGHIYPEIFVGSKEQLAIVGNLIQQKLFVKESKGKKLNYHNDKEGNIWLNLDYTTSYPGGNFMSSDVMEYIYP
jgi:hypothetical protein